MAVAAQAADPEEIRPIASRLELFVDHYLVDTMSGTELRLNHPTDAGTALAFDRPWEGQYSNYATVIKDGPVYRLYYRWHADRTRRRTL
jgi:hypothetical protein